MYNRYRIFNFSLTLPASQSSFTFHSFTVFSPDFPFFFLFHLLPTLVSSCSSSVRLLLLRGLFTFAIWFIIRRSPIIILSSSSSFSFPSSFAFVPPLELISSVHVRVSRLHCCHVQAISLFSYCLLGLMLLLCLMFPFFLFLLG